jgi:sigma-B regulation protein RsbU (phosphoserine phosphatase)
MKPDVQSTIRLLKDLSRSKNPGELVQLFFQHVRRNIGIDRALVLSRVALMPPQFHVVHDVTHHGHENRAAGGSQKLRSGGVLAKMLYEGEFQNVADFEPDPSDPASDLLQDSRSLIALPLFDNGVSAGMVVLLGGSPGSVERAEICALAMASSLLGRAIETQKLADQLADACRALDSELKAAADVQRWLLPPLPKFADVAVAASYRTARYSSGDYYDVGPLADGRVGVLIADVSGKGAAAAVLMAVLRSIVHDELDIAKVTGPASLLDYADAHLRALGLVQRRAFITVFCGILDPASGQFIYSCAGHYPPRILRAQDRSITSLDGAQAVPLGILDEPTPHTENVTVLMPGDLALLYTDGIVEARSPSGEFFGLERLDQLLSTIPAPPTPDAAVQAIAKAVAKFERDSVPADDQTLVAVARTRLTVSS